MDWLQFGVQWLHVLLGIFWFGNAIAVAAILIPAISTLPIPTQRQVGGRYADMAERTFKVVAPAVIVLGIVRGTLFGPIRSVDALTTTYGITWIIALVAAVATFLWGLYVIGGAAQVMNAAPLAADGGPTPELERATARVKRVAVLELIGFIVVFTCMILMRFGLQAAPIVVTAAALCSLALGLGFGLPAIVGTLHFAQAGDVWTFLGFPTYGGGPFEGLGLPTSVPLLVAFVLVCLAEVAVGVMLLLNVPHAAPVSYLLLPFEFVFWIGFALPFGPPLGIARTVLLLLA